MEIICSLFPGYGITLEVFTTLFNRFATKRKYMKPEDFARCLCRLKTMNGNAIIEIVLLLLDMVALQILLTD